MAARKKKTVTDGISALQLIEEAVHLVRRAPAGTLVIYYAGATAWALGFLFFWAHTTWFAPTAETLLWTSLGLTVLFAVLKYTQAEFCARLLAQRMGALPPEFSWKRSLKIAAAQMALQSWGLFLLPVALVITLPFGWVYAFYQNLLVLDASSMRWRKLMAEAVEQSKLWPGQNHLGLLYQSLLALVVWANIGGVFYLIPQLANRLLGIDNIFGFSGWWFFNTTFVASVTMLSWLAVDPLVKAFYVLRIFHGRAQRTGDDIRVEIAMATKRSQPARATAAASALLLMLALWLVPISALRAEEIPPVAAAPSQNTVKPASLDKAIDDVFSRRDFQWQIRHKRNLAAEKKSEDGPIVRFLRQGVKIAQEMIDSVRRTFNRLKEWIEDFFPKKKEEIREEKKTTAGDGFMNIMRPLLYVFMVVAAGLILFVIYLMIKKGVERGGGVLTARAITLAQPDLRDENIHAAQMPADGWIAMAHEQMAKGEWRLALRALYLASLARLASEGLLSLAKFKTNLDYEREVRRRSLAQPEIADRFATRRRDFESVWYGHDEASENSVRAWLRELEGVPTA